MEDRRATRVCFVLWQVGDVHAGAGRRAAVFELMARPDAALDFGAAMQGAGHSVVPSGLPAWHIVPAGFQRLCPRAALAPQLHEAALHVPAW